MFMSCMDTQLGNHHSDSKSQRGVVDTQTVSSMIHQQKDNNLHEQLQSAYQHFHRTKTGLIKVINRGHKCCSDGNGSTEGGVGST